MVLAPIHLERTDGDALGDIVHACSVVWVWRRVTNQIEPRFMISMSNVFKPNRFRRDHWMVLILCLHPQRGLLVCKSTCQSVSQSVNLSVCLLVTTRFLQLRATR